ncbi:PREDICTED: uncharacterized protein LOC104822240 [Tarenaya hassleriana]|uniref:uncharacterized protein LOC104822240 n=1 Tax=Tarenaya hassleriana TaxID=28532 RepID=UPI00053C8856|nr:PREDICTED: uncharacterized protein LOC104822240 [Tarenaya hassleriana]
MSAPSSRRLKDANAGGGQKPLPGQKPSKPLTPVSISRQNPRPALQKSSSSKENPRPSYRSFGSTQKPVLRSVPRVEKSAIGGGGGEDGCCGGEGRVRWSTSCGPRGRSPSPSDLIRVFSDLRREKGSRVSLEKGELSSDKKARYRNLGGKRVENDKKVSDTLCKSSRVCEETEEESRIKTDLGSDPLKASNLEDSSTRRSSSCDLKVHALLGCESKSAVASKSVGKMENIGRGTNSVSRKKSLDNGGKVLEILKEKRGVEGTSGLSIKYQSKLQEKLAFLEGKVKKIASDIKKTKDMLDLNNPDASKVIISDIQEKISGIEKAMSHVVSDADDKNNLPSLSSNEEKKEPGDNENEIVENVKSSVKGLNNEELEDRLFPHQRLLRSRTQSKTMSEVSKNQDVSDSVESSMEIRVEVNPLDHTEENGKSEITIRSDQPDSKHLEVQHMEVEEMSKKRDSSKQISVTSKLNEILRADETLEEFDDEGDREDMELEEIEDACMYRLNEIGAKTSTGGWFVSEGEAVLLGHDDGSCSYYDIANCEVKSVYNPPIGISPNTWRDCWIVRAACADGCSGRYVVAASAGNTQESGFCSWDFYTKQIKAFHIEDGAKRADHSTTVLAPLSNNTPYGMNTVACSLAPEARQWWYRPSGPLIASTVSSQRLVRVFDIRDGEQIMRWELQKPVSAIDYSSPLQWRNRGKVVIAETEAISVWDVNSQHPEAQLTISSSGRKISAFHINNTDAELGGGVRQRVSSSEAEGNDGVFCTIDSINILDFRHPTGIGAKILKLGVNAQCISSRGDSIFLGCANSRSTVNKHPASQVQQFSLRKQRLVSTYTLPESKYNSHHSAITQVWGDTSLVMAISGMGLSVFDSAKDEMVQPLMSDYENVKETIGPDDMYSPSFDYSDRRVLLISRDRPALWGPLL